MWGDSLSDSRYFGRSMEAGEIMPIRVNENNPCRSKIDIRPTKTYISERKAILVAELLIAFVLLGVVLIGRL